MTEFANNVGLVLVVVFAAFFGASIFFRSELKRFGLYRKSVLGTVISFIVVCLYASVVGVHVS